MSVADNALATLNECKDFYGMTASKQADDDLIEDLIDRVTQLFETYCGITSFKAADYTEYIDGQSDKYIFPKNTPINSVTSIHDDTDWVWGANELLDASDYRIVDEKYVVYNSGVFSLGEQNIRIIYNGGFTTIPLDLKQACIEEVMTRYKHRKDMDVIQKSQEDGNVTYNQAAFLPSTLVVLNKYRPLWVH